MTRFWVRISVAISAGTIVGVTGALLPKTIGDAMQALAAGLLAYWLTEVDARRMELISDFNHHARNAVHIIQMAEKCPTPNHAEIVNDTCDHLIADGELVSTRLNSMWIAHKG